MKGVFLMVNYLMTNVYIVWRIMSYKGSESKTFGGVYLQKANAEKEGQRWKNESREIWLNDTDMEIEYEIEERLLTK